MTQTRYAIELYVVVPSAYQAAANARFANYGLGPDNFSVGLSASGLPPAQAYHAMVALELTDLPNIVWLADNAPAAWLWVRVRTEYLKTGQAKALQQLVDNFDLASYQLLNWTTREKAYIHISTTPINPTAALDFIHSNADPTVTLQPITQA